MSDVEAAARRARTAEVLAIAERAVDNQTFRIIKSALEADDRMAVIRDAFIAGRDHEAVHMIRELDPVGPRWLLPMSRADIVIEPGQTAQITSRPQMPFQPTHLLVSKRCADFVIHDIKIAMRSYFAQSGDVPADLFVVDAPELDAVVSAPGMDTPIAITVNAKVGRVGIALDLPIVRVGWDVTLTVSNHGTTTVPFLACWLGEAKWASQPLAALVDGTAAV